MFFYSMINVQWVGRCGVFGGCNPFFWACVLFFLPFGGWAQQPATAPADTTNKLRVESSLLGESFLKDGRELRVLSGQVRLRQGNTVIYCDRATIDQDDATLGGNVAIQQGDTVRAFADSALYFGRTRQSDLFGKVVLENGPQKLFTKRLHYDVANKIATYNAGATMTDGHSQLVSRRGYYFVNDKQFFMKGGVVITDPEFTLRTDTLWYDTEASTAHFVAPTLISRVDGRIYTEGGFYDITNKYAEFDKNPQYERKDQRGRAEKMRYNGVSKAYILEGSAYVQDSTRKVEADQIWYNTDVEQVLLTGNARYRDSSKTVTGERIFFDSRNKSYQLRGRSEVVDGTNRITADSLDFQDQLGTGKAVGRVIWRDTAAKVTILAHRLDYNKQTGYFYAHGGFGPMGNRGRPLLKTPVDRDTLYMAADTISAFKPDTASDRRLLLAHQDVRIYKKDMQVVADSLAFDSADSTFRFFPLRRFPIMWSDTTQFSGDTLYLTLRNNKPYRVRLRQNALVVSAAQDDFYNQIKGKYNTIHFNEEGKAKLMRVEGNAELVYYALDDKKEYLGVDQSQCSEIKVQFDKGKLSEVRFYGSPQSTFFPMKGLPAEGKRIKGFFWERTRRPRSVADLLSTGVNPTSGK